LRRFLGIGLTALAVAAIWLTASAELSRGEKMPPMTMTDLNGKQIKIAASGKVQIIDFWATWCGPCRQAIPGLQALHKKYQSRGLQVIGVAMQSGTAQDVKQFVKQHGMTYPICMPPDSVLHKYQVQAFPTLYVVDKKGVVRHAQVGFSLASEKAIHQAVTQLLAE
jgi:thiol-disulfide isomerase/thioredoxin